MKSTIIYKTFQEYYTKDFHIENAPKQMDKREFGFVLFSQGVVVRHKRFKSIDELKAFMRENVPSDAYYSCAYYDDPEAEMDKKGWLGADLIFDIDADHIPTNCDRVHEEWTCTSCGFYGKGVVPENCPICGGEKFDVKTWPCEKCLTSAKMETLKLLSFLINDFGFSKDEIQLFFSGNRGYHVHVVNEAVKELDSFARKEIVDYLFGVGLEVPFHAPLVKKSKKGMEIGRGMKFSSFGWPQRLRHGTQKFLEEADENHLKEIGLKLDVIRAIIENRDALLKGLNEHGGLPLARGVGFGTWKRILEHIAKLQSAKIDTVVTTDVHRLIRLPNTLNSKTGFKKVEVPISKLEEFDPFKEAIAIRTGSIKVKVTSAPAFRVGNETFGPYRDMVVELPTAAALLLICRERAEAVEQQ
ncbi:MAG: DNA primase small subunit PriS [Candidatus Bathyarchaeia archaeon]